MIERFLIIQQQIKRALFAMKVSIDFTDDDLKAVEELSNDLEPLKSAALIVCNKMTLSAILRESWN